jgi:hypothetical protein
MTKLHMSVTSTYGSRVRIQAVVPAHLAKKPHFCTVFFWREGDERLAVAARRELDRYYRWGQGDFNAAELLRTTIALLNRDIK